MVNNITNFEMCFLHDRSGFRLCMHYNGKYDEESRKYLGGTELASCAHGDITFDVVEYGINKASPLSRSL